MSGMLTNIRARFGFGSAPEVEQETELKNISTANEKNESSDGAQIQTPLGAFAKFDANNPVKPRITITAGNTQQKGNSGITTPTSSKNAPFNGFPSTGLSRPISTTVQGNAHAAGSSGSSHVEEQSHASFSSSGNTVDTGHVPQPAVSPPGTGETGKEDPVNSTRQAANDTIDKASRGASNDMREALEANAKQVQENMKMTMASAMLNAMQERVNQLAYLMTSGVKAIGQALRGQ
jgi:hypothetical protein